MALSGLADYTAGSLGLAVPSAIDRLDPTLGDYPLEFTTGDWA